MGPWGAIKYSTILVSMMDISSVSSVPVTRLTSSILDNSRRSYYQKQEAIIFVVDSTDVDRLNIAKEELLSILEVTMRHGPGHTSGIPTGPRNTNQTR